jgi:hypothetical protein
MGPGSSSSDVAEIPGMDPGSSSPDAALIPGTSFLSFPRWRKASSGICLSISFHSLLLFLIQQQRPSSKICLSVSLHSLLSSQDGNKPTTLPGICLLLCIPYFPHTKAKTTPLTLFLKISKLLS